MKNTVYFGGSRNLPQAAYPFVFHVVSAVLAAGQAVAVGCAVGADQQVIQAALGSSSFQQVHVFAAFAPSGAGSWGGSAVSVVQAFAAAGGSVSWLAGGSLAVPISARLMARSVAGLSGASAAVFFQPGVGSLKVARAALRAGIPVLVGRAGVSAAPVLAVAPVATTWLGCSFWLFAPPVQAALF